MSEVRVFKITTGEEVISRIKSDYVSDDFYTLVKPRVVAIAPGPGGQMSVTLIPLFASNQDGNATLNKSHIVGEPESINPELEKGYIEQTSGIALS